ncbi:MAG TPA: OmpA family protein [Bacteroidales bacterium]|nr:OmpA family protein [Bacteroidales bacterium]
MNLIKKCTVLFAAFVFILLNVSNAQTSGNKALLDSAYTYFEMENYPASLACFLKLKTSEPENANIDYHIGVCYKHMPSEKYKAIPYLEMAVKNISRDHTGTKDEKTAPADAYFYLGTAYLINYDLEKAVAATEQYKTLLNPNDESEKIKFKNADRQIAMARVAKELIKDPIPITVENLGKHVNTRFPEYAPAIVLDGNTLLFTARRDENVGDMVEDNGYYFEDIYMSKKSEITKWTEAINIKTVNTQDHEASISLSSDKKQLFIYKDDGGDGNVYVSNHSEHEWQKPVKLGNPINSKAWETHASLSSDGNTIYFTSDRKGGYGGLDIYKSEKNANGKWGEAINLGNVINTEFNDDGPFLLYDNVLYFCSQGHKTMGGYDIFYSRLKNDSTWSEPVNIGYPINTTDDDLFYTPVDSLTAYFASVRVIDSYGTPGFGNLDIYRLTIHPVVIKGIAYDKHTREILPGAKVYLLNDKMEIIEETVADTNGAYCFPASYNRNYFLKASKDSYTDATDKASTYNIGEKKEVVVDLFPERIFDVSLKIHVDDAQTYMPLNEVRVIVKDVLSGDTVNLITDENGDIVKNLPDKKNNDSLHYEIEFAKQGYLDKNLDFRYHITKPGEILIKENLGKLLIRGLVLNKQTKEIIPGADVFLMDEKMDTIDRASADDKAAFSFSADYDRKYYLSARKKSYTEGNNTVSTYNAGNTREFTANLLLEQSVPVSLKILIFDANTNEILKDVKIEMKDMQSGKIEILMTDKNGELFIPLEHKTINDSLVYNMVISKETYLAKYFKYRYLIKKPGEIVIREPIGRLEVGTDLAKVIQINNIYFDFDKYYIRPDAAIELDKIVKIMNENPSIVIELGSHTDCRNTYAYNEVLSKNRAKSSVAYIVSKGIDPKRITGKGYGEYQMLVNCPCEGTRESQCTEEDHQMNRRTEFRIIGFIDGMGNVSIKSDKGSDILVDPKPGTEWKKGNNEPLKKQSFSAQPSDKIYKTIEDKAKPLDNLIYRVQIMTSGTDLPATDPLFKGLQNVYKYKQKGLYKYTWGETNLIEEAEQIRLQMKEKGFHEAFIVPFYKNSRITLEELEELLKNNN